MRGPGRVTFLGGAAGGYTQCARVYHSADQSIPNVTWTALAFNSEWFDTDGIHDTVTNNSRLTCQTAGKYLIIGQVRLASSSTGTRWARILLNGATEIALEKQGVVAGTTSLPPITTIYDLAVGDYVELGAYQDSGAALNVITHGNTSPEFMMVRVA